MVPSKKDKLFAGTEAPVKFEFDESVATVFDDMLERSVPMYTECQKLVVEMANCFIKDESKVYDLGCSTGTLIKLLATSLPDKSDVVFAGVDNSAPMLERARKKLNGIVPECELIESDIEADLKMSNASLVIMNYTLQFLSPPRRDAMVKKIFQALNPGGAFILIEKVIAESGEMDELFVQSHHDFKHKKGYSKLEIAKKKEALDNVLIPLKLSENINLLKEAGFDKTEVFFKWLNFAGIISIKN
ncbi:MAG: carboxy-S-adenosyl-L-methionine synthase CmoA [Nitrospinales bacterium]